VPTQIGKQFGMMEVSVLKVYQLTADGATGGSLTFNTGIQCIGAQELGFEPGTMDVARWVGDNEVLRLHSRIKNLKGKFTLASLPLDALAFIMGGTLTQTGSSPNTTTTFNLDGTEMSYFKIEALIPYAKDMASEIGANAKIVIPKVKLVGGPQANFNGNPTATAISWECVRPMDVNSRFWASMIFGESAQTLSA
jgi:hypothetical protein